MPRHIDATLLKAEFTGNFIDTSYSPEFIKAIIDRQPTADVQEVRHGKWIRGNYVCGEYEFKCSVCGNTEWHTSYSTPFCPHCGARMDLDENEYR